MSARVTGTTKFGWCIDGLHGRCWGVNGSYECGCECHREDA